MRRSGLSFASALAASAALALVVLASCPAQAQFAVTNFQTIDPPFAFPAPGNPYDDVSGAGGISSSGAVVGYYTDMDDPGIPSIRGYILQNGVYTSVSYPDQAGTLYNNTQLTGINSSGVSTGFYAAYDVVADELVSQTAFIRSSAGVFSTPTVTPTATGIVTAFGAINDAGLVATQYTDGGLTHAALYNANANTFSLLLPDVVAGGNTYIQTINNHGDIVGSYDDGQAGDAQPFIYRNGAYTNISYAAPGAMATRFNGINSAGIVSGRYLDSKGLSHGLLYNSNNGFFFTFDVPGARQTFLYQGSINDFNQIAGTYADQKGVTHSFTANAVSAPEPSPLALLLTTGGSLLGSAALVRRRRRSRSHSSKCAA